MGPGASDTVAGKAMMRGLRRAIADMGEHELRANLTEIRDHLDAALALERRPVSVPSLHDASLDVADFASSH